MVPNWQGVTDPLPCLGKKLNETFQIEILALAPRLRLSRPHTVSVPRQSDTRPFSCAHVAPQRPISLALPIAQGRRLWHVLRQPDDPASFVEGDQHSIELVRSEVNGFPAPPVHPTLALEPVAQADVSLAISAIYVYPELAVGTPRQGRNRLDQVWDSVEAQFRHRLI